MVEMDGQGEEVLGDTLGGGSWWLVARMTSPPKDSSVEEAVSTLQIASVSRLISCISFSNVIFHLPG